MRKITLLAILSFLVFSNTTIKAQNSDHRWALGVYMNWINFHNSNDWQGKHQMVPSEFSVGRFISPSFNVVGSFATNKFDVWQSDEYKYMRMLSTNKFWDANASLEYKFANGYLLKESSWFSPYLYAGVGLTNFNTTSYAKELIGAGVDVYIIPCLALNVHGSADVLNSSNDYLHLSAGLKFRFGKAKDTDKDGVADKDDRCPTEFGLKELKGCPDSDGDGIADLDDKCPNTPTGVKVDATGCPVDSDKDGVGDYLDKCPNTPAGVKVDEKGCPVDSDNDGVADYLDKCPDTPAGVKADENGCPIDTDKDGIPDYLDKCPAVAGIAANNGCPEIKVEAVKIPEISKTIYFSSGNVNIKAIYHKDLDKVVTYLKDNAAAKLNINGYADEIGPDAMNMKLSERRAANVVKYITSKGVSTDRLVKTAYGEGMPAADNKTSAGRALNRRVEIKTVK